MLTVRVSMDDEEVFYRISEKNVRKIMGIPIEAQSPNDRYGTFLKLAKPARLHSDDTDLYIDASGNRTFDQFWNSEDALPWSEAAGCKSFDDLDYEQARKIAAASLIQVRTHCALALDAFGKDKKISSFVDKAFAELTDLRRKLISRVIKHPGRDL